MGSKQEIHPAVSDLFAQAVRSNYVSHYNPHFGELDEEFLIGVAITFLDTLSELVVIAGQITPEALVANFLGRQ